eukprot:g8265.t1
MNNRGVTAVYVGCQEGHLELVRLLIHHQVNLNTVTNIGSSPLMIATRGGYSQIVKALLNNGADVNIQTIKMKQTALWIACYMEFDDIVSMLCQRTDIQANLQSSDGTTALHQSLLTGNIKIMRILVEEGAVDVNMQDNKGRTAIHLACMNEDIEQLKLLMKFKAKVNLTTLNGDTILSIISHANSSRFKDFARALLEREEEELMAPLEPDSYPMESDEEDFNTLYLLFVLGFIFFLLTVVAVVLTRRRYVCAMRKSQLKAMERISLRTLPTEFQFPGNETPGPSTTQRRSYMTGSTSFHTLLPEFQNPNRDSPVSFKDLPIARHTAPQDKPSHKTTVNQKHISLTKTQGSSLDRTHQFQFHQRQLHCPIVNPRYGVGTLARGQNPHPTPRLTDQTLSTTGNDWIGQFSTSDPDSFLNEWLSTNSSERN